MITQDSKITSRFAVMQHLEMLGIGLFSDNVLLNVEENGVTCKTLSIEAARSGTSGSLPHGTELVGGWGRKNVWQ